MVDYAKDQKLIPVEELDQLRLQVRDGDLTVVMKSYEQSMRHPFQSVVAGDMVRLVLIQIHKTKVDMEIAMQALDKLLRSNELNFAFLAVVPTLLVMGATYQWFGGLWKRQKDASMDWVHAQCRMSFREVERLLNQSTTMATSGGGCGTRSAIGGATGPTPAAAAPSSAAAPLDFTTMGLLLVETYVLQENAHRLPVGVRVLFLEDIHELDQVETLAQKQRCLDRIYRTYWFLQPVRS